MPFARSISISADGASFDARAAASVAIQTSSTHSMLDALVFFVDIEICIGFFYANRQLQNLLTAYIHDGNHNFYAHVDLEGEGVADSRRGSLT
jgi:hypothetical protein